MWKTNNIVCSPPQSYSYQSCDDLLRTAGSKHSDSSHYCTFHTSATSITRRQAPLKSSFETPP